MDLRQAFLFTADCIGHGVSNIFWEGGNFFRGSSCLCYYAYRKMVAVKMVFVMDFIWGGGGKVGGRLAAAPTHRGMDCIRFLIRSL